MFSRPSFLLLALLTGTQAWASPESTQLALVLKQLDGVKTSLERAQTSASTDPQSRYFFDYQQAQQD
ncbi:RAQPRD family integrative conjugative element protein, partial [Klebsiella michiganensis]